MPPLSPSVNARRIVRPVALIDRRPPAHRWSPTGDAGRRQRPRRRDDLASSSKIKMRGRASERRRRSRRHRAPCLVEGRKVRHPAVEVERAAAADRDCPGVQRPSLKVIGSEAVEGQRVRYVIGAPGLQVSAGPVVPMVSEPDVSVLAACESSTSWPPAFESIVRVFAAVRSSRQN